MIHIQIDETFQAQINADLLRLAAVAVLAHQEIAPDSELTIVIGDEQQLHDLNKTYLGVDAPTDVLSFPAGDPNPDSGEIYLGDVIIAYPKAAAQAQAAGHPVAEELQLLVAHGTLHLLGFDHASPEEKATMWAAQDEILQAINVRARPHE